MTRADLERAIDLAVQGAWDEAHAIVQVDEVDPTACWIHAVIHKLEGDSGNAHSWYRRAERLAHAADDPAIELATIRQSLHG